jgi:hypothetical protein
LCMCGSGAEKVRRLFGPEEEEGSMRNARLEKEGGV